MVGGLGPVRVLVIQDLVDLLPVVAEDVLHVGPDDLRLARVRDSLVDLLLLEVGVGLVLRDAEHHRHGGELGLPFLRQAMVGWL